MCLRFRDFLHIPEDLSVHNYLNIVHASCLASYLRTNHSLYNRRVALNYIFDRGDPRPPQGVWTKKTNNSEGQDSSKSRWSLSTAVG